MLSGGWPAASAAAEVTCACLSTSCCVCRSLNSCEWHGARRLLSLGAATPHVSMNVPLRLLRSTCSPAASASTSAMVSPAACARRLAVASVLASFAIASW